jgi:hypothetical protein
VGKCAGFNAQKIIAQNFFQVPPLNFANPHVAHPTMADHVTQPSNAYAHPGIVDRNPTCRSKEEIQAEKQAKAEAKARAVAEKKAYIDKVVALEKGAKEKAKGREQEANDPVDCRGS